MNNMKREKAWIGVDLDGTLVKYKSGQFNKKGREFIGEPIRKMCDRVRKWIADGVTIKIITARIEDGVDCSLFIQSLNEFCTSEFGQILEATNKKDYGMVTQWDDRAMSVIPNT